MAYTEVLGIHESHFWEPTKCFCNQIKTLFDNSNVLNILPTIKSKIDISINKCGLLMCFCKGLWINWVRRVKKRLRRLEILSTQEDYLVWQYYKLIQMIIVP